MTDRALRIVVLDGRGDTHANEVTAAIAEALQSEQTADVAGDGRAEASTADALLHDADAAVVLDDGSLLRAREAGAPLCVVVLPGFDAGWAGDFAEADLVLVAHESLVGAVVRRGASREDVVVVGPVPPVGYVPAKDRGALRAEVGVDHDGSLVLVPSAVLEEEGTEAILIQLALASPNVAFLFDVDSDPDVAEELRRVVPTHGLTAWMFADERDSVRFWQIADVVIARARGHEVARALGVGAPLVLLPPGRSDATAARAIEAAGIGRDADVLATLAVTIDAAVEPDALRDGRDAIAALSVGASAERLSEAVRGAWKRRSTTGRAAPPRGLPHGLEPLPASRERSPHRSSLPPADDDLEARIDRELAELKKRL